MSEANFSQEKERVIVYVDGFNLYFGIKEAGFENCKWLDIHKLVNSLMKPSQQLISIKYFTSRVSNNPDKQKDNLYLLKPLKPEE